MKAIGLLIMSLTLLACNGSEDRATREIEAPRDWLAAPDVRARGRVLYREKCALCHGVQADGNGMRREGLSRRPVNFRGRDWRESTDPRHVYSVVSEGKRGTSMPAWPTLSEEERWAVVAYVLSVAEEGP